MKTHWTMWVRFHFHKCAETSFGAEPNQWPKEVSGCIRAPVKPPVFVYSHYSQVSFLQAETPPYSCIQEPSRVPQRRRHPEPQDFCWYIYVQMCKSLHVKWHSAVHMLVCTVFPPPTHCYWPDQKYETVILPMHGTATPFHISTIKVNTAAVSLGGFRSA